MSIGEKSLEAWPRAYAKKDYSLIEPLLHPDYLCHDYRMGIELNFESEKVLIETLSDFFAMCHRKILYENENILVISWFSKHNEVPPRYVATMTTDTIKDKKLFYRHIIREFLDYDPSEGQDWNWEDYE